MHARARGSCFLALILGVATGSAGPAQGSVASAPSSTTQSRTSDLIYVPTPPEVVDQMLKIANVRSNDVVYDLGSGDGRIVIAAAKEFGARGVGVEIDPRLVRQATDNARLAGVADRVVFLNQDLFGTNLSEATVVTLYLLSSLNLKLRPKLLAELKPGARVVSHQFDMGSWKPEAAVELGGHVVYLWRVPPR